MLKRTVTVAQLPVMKCITVILMGVVQLRVVRYGMLAMDRTQDVNRMILILPVLAVAISLALPLIPAF